MKSNTKNSYKKRILQTQLYIQQHLDVELSLEQLAQISCFSKYHFHRIFKALVGENLQAYIRRLRIERAIQQLRYEPETSIINIALAAGYQTHEAFSRIVKEAYGLSPKAIRELPVFSPQDYQVKTTTHLENYQMNVEIKNIDAIKVAFIRHVGPYEKIRSVWEKLSSWAIESHFFAHNPDCLRIGIAYDDPSLTDESKLRYDACLSLTNDHFTLSSDEIATQTLRGGRYAIARQKGPYEQFNDSYAWLYGKWLPEQKLEPVNAPSFVVLHNSPKDTAPEDLIADIYIPLQ